MEITRWKYGLEYDYKIRFKISTAQQKVNKSGNNCNSSEKYVL
jgi:hypothetical protein